MAHIYARTDSIVQTYITDYILITAI